LMRKRVREHDVAYWAESFLGTLAQTPDTWPLAARGRPVPGISLQQSLGR
jgi:trehalose-6-phosphate synthase